MPYKDEKKRKLYYRNYMKRIRKEKPWYNTYTNILHRCCDTGSRYNNKGIRNHLTLTNLEFLWFRDKAYLLKKPSIHRVDSHKDYTFENCKYIEFIENCKEGGQRVKEIFLEKKRKAALFRKDGALCYTISECL